MSETEVEDADRTEPVVHREFVPDEGEFVDISYEPPADTPAPAPVSAPRPPASGVSPLWVGMGLCAFLGAATAGWFFLAT